jgi:hypothetical protein
MPKYVCLLGDVQEVNLSEPGSFVVADAKGRNWYCREVSEQEFNTNFPASIFEMMRTQQQAHEQGFSSEGTRRNNIECERNELPARLGAIN